MLKKHLLLLSVFALTAHYQATCFFDDQETESVYAYLRAKEAALVQQDAFLEAELNAALRETMDQDLQRAIKNLNSRQAQANFEQIILDYFNSRKDTEEETENLKDKQEDRTAKEPVVTLSRSEKLKKFLVSLPKICGCR